MPETPLSYPDVVFLYGKEKKHTIKIVRERKCVAMFYRTIITRMQAAANRKKSILMSGKEILDSYTDSDTIILFSSTTIER